MDGTMTFSCIKLERGGFLRRRIIYWGILLGCDQQFSIGHENKSLHKGKRYDCSDSSLGWLLATATKGNSKGSWWR